MEAGSTSTAVTACFCLLFRQGPSSRATQGTAIGRFVDLNPNPEDGAFERYVHSALPHHRTDRIEDRRLLSSVTGPAAVASAARRIRQLAASHGTSELNLFLRTPWPASVLLGRELNTLSVRLHEWHRVDGSGTYQPVIRVAAGEGRGPIQEVF
jgi:hypothetical protein